MHIVLTGTYNSSNKGDAAMQQTLTNMLHERIQNLEVVIASPFPSTDRNYYKNVTVIKSRRRNLVFSTVELIVLMLVGRWPQYLKKYKLSEEIDAMISADMVVDLSGDMLTEDYGAVIGFSHFIPLLKAHYLNKPYMICAQSIGPFRRLARCAFHVLSNASAITTREELSEKYIRKFLSSSSSVKTADLAFLMKPASHARAKEILEKESVHDTGRPRLGVSLSALLLNNINRHIKGNDREANLSMFSRALDRVATELDVQILFLPHVFGPRPKSDDRNAIKDVIERMKTTPASIRNEYRAEELKAVIATCTIFIGSRMHANIAALDCNIPVLAIGYSHKTEGILKELELGQWVLQSNNIDEAKLFSSAKRLLSSIPEYRGHLNTRIPLMRARANRNIDILLGMLDK